MSEGVPEMSNSVEQLSDWRERKEEAFAAATARLERGGLAVDVALATPEELSHLINDLPQIIDELSFDEAGNVRNENRYLARLLATHLEKARRRVAYEAVPSIAA